MSITATMKTLKPQYRWLCFCLGMLLIVPFKGNATETLEKVGRDLNAIKITIDSLKSTLHEQKKIEGAQRQQLKDIESHILTSANDLEGIQREVHDQDKAFQQITDTQKDLIHHVEKNQSILTNQVTSAYFIQKTQGLKILFNLQNPHALNRVLHYYRYLNQGSTRQIQQSFTQLQNINSEVQTLLEAQKKQLALKDAQEQQMAQLKALRSQQETMLLSVQDQITVSQKQLSHSKADEQKLISRLNSIQIAIATLPPPLPPGQSFEKSKGALHWPLSTPKQASYSSTSNLNPFMIKAKVGDRIHAIFHGRVVFAEPLRGFGLLMIIDHGNEYMSLYGNNHVLYQKVGEVVERGQLIGKLGQKDPGSGLENSVLYFEIRKNGQPIRSGSWFK
jgi:septal ring factor EnvC (AmiA/AmiB activator)